MSPDSSSQQASGADFWFRLMLGWYRLVLGWCRLVTPWPTWQVSYQTKSSWSRLITHYAKLMALAMAGVKLVGTGGMRPFWWLVGDSLVVQAILIVGWCQPGEPLVNCAQLDSLLTLAGHDIKYIVPDMYIFNNLVICIQGLVWWWTVWITKVWAYQCSKFWLTLISHTWPNKVWTFLLMQASASNLYLSVARWKRARVVSGGIIK